ncbi:MAG: sterol desaturase family protein [Alphaproteobacteria bacterium]|nr:sterol desaturase family protein [Alphaproteobacteria bacterium]
MDPSLIGLSNAGLFVAAALVAVGFWEHAVPERPASMPAGPRWIANFALYGLSTLLAAGLGLLLGDAAGTLLPRLPFDGDALGPLAHAAIVILAMDLAHYWLHRLLHAQLWRVHAVHHTDPDPDVSTAVRHHPAEIIPTTALTVFVGGLFGATAGELAAYGVLAFAVQALAHANVALPRSIAGAMQAVVVTPGFHRVHHSRDERECHANYGQVFTIWDRLFGTAIAPSRAAPVAYGVDGFLAPRFQRVGTILMQPVLPPDRPATEAATRAEPPGRVAPARRGASSSRSAALRHPGRRRAQRR